MQNPDTNAADARRTFHLVVSPCVERGYPGDTLSLAREACEVAHLGDRDAAVARLLSELDANLAEGAVLALRRSFLLEVSVPLRMLGGGCPRRWTSDRWPELVRRCGDVPGAWASAVQRGDTGDLVLTELAAALGALGAGMAGGGDTPGGVPALALVVAGSASRAAAEGGIPATLAKRLIGVAKAIGAAAWAGEDVSHLGPALDAILPDVPPPPARAGAEADIPAGRAIADAYGFEGLLRAVPAPEGGWGSGAGLAA